MDELATLLSDAKSIIDQIQQLESGESAGQMGMGGGMESTLKAVDAPTGELPAAGGELDPAGMSAPVMPTPEEEGKKKMAMKSDIATTGTSEGTTASDDADTRLLDDQTNLDEKEVQAIMKAQKMGLITVKKKADRNSEIVSTLTALNRAVKSLTGFVSDHHQAIESIIQGLGYGDMIRKSYTGEASRSVMKSNRPVITGQSDSLEEIRKGIDNLQSQLVKKDQPEESSFNFNRGAEVRKDIGSVLPSLFGNRL